MQRIFYLLRCAARCCCEDIFFVKKYRLINKMSSKTKWAFTFEIFFVVTAIMVRRRVSRNRCERPEWRLTPQKTAALESSALGGIVPKRIRTLFFLRHKTQRAQITAKTVFERFCLFVCLERASARIPALHRPVEWHKPSYKEIV